ncbi:MAG: TetR/AcrR family transcriptional regulator [Gaiellales bacterium]
MSTSYELTGRTTQKARTRGGLVVAARVLLAEGVFPTVEQAADRAGISRTTAYRYFKNRRALLAACYPELEAPSLLGGDPPADPVERIEIAVEHFVRQTLEHEPELRAELRLSLDPASKSEERPLRTGRGIGWMEDALAPLREHLSDTDFRRLVLAVRAGCGIEALIWLVDIAGVSRDEAAATMTWTARTLVESAVAAAARGDA